jgi:CheY-like chemotaxis protein
MNMTVIKALVHRLRPEAVLLEAQTGVEAVAFLEAQTGVEAVAFLEAQTGVEAVALYRECRPDLILMEVQMPEMDGLEATRIIRSRNREDGYDVPIVAMTAGVFKEERERCLRLG